MEYLKPSLFIRSTQERIGNMELKYYKQYKFDIFNKLNFNFKRGKKVLDVGCGGGSDSNILSSVYGLDVWAIDVYEHPGIRNDLGDRFKLNKKGIYDLPYDDSAFDYVFMHDILHHIDEKTQSFENHLLGLQEASRVVKKGGYIIIVEGNRYNPIFFPHMVKHLGHEHFSYSYFKRLIRTAYGQGSNVLYKNFEAHFYPQALLPVMKIYEKLMEALSPRRFLSYNVAIIKKK